MRRSLAQSLLLVIALIVANCPCVLSCFEEPSQAAPCHGHNPSKDDQTSKRCAHSPVVGEERAPSSSIHTFVQVPHDVVVVVPAIRFFFLGTCQNTARYAISPPGSPALLHSAVLRV